MNLVLAILVAYVLAASIWPHIVRQRELFMLGVVTLAAAMVLESFSFRLVMFLGNLGEAAAFVLLVASGGSAGLEQVWSRIRR